MYFHFHKGFVVKTHFALTNHFLRFLPNIFSTSKNL